MSRMSSKDYSLVMTYDILAKDLTPFYIPVKFLPDWNFSDETPPKEIEKGGEIITIDRYLGLYEPETREITIYQKGIEQASRILSCNYNDLKIIVELHEWFHALIHVGVEPQGWKDQILDAIGKGVVNKKMITSIENEDLVAFHMIERRLHEHLAQLLTYYSCDILEKTSKISLSEIFNTLSQRQPSEYRIDNSLEYPKEKVIRSIQMIKSGWLKGLFEAWTSIMTL